MALDLSKFQWICQPDRFELTDDTLTIYTDPSTDYWQRTYYGFRHNNAHAFLISVAESAFSFTVKTSWKPAKLFDQCGIVLYQDEDNWFKASIEYDNENFSRLGSVVTNSGFSDWSTSDVNSATQTMSYRLSRRGQDFRIENSEDGQEYKQMRIFHMHQPIKAANIGAYACSPLTSSMKAVFTDFALGPCQWELFMNPGA
jgi:regulation of enolase protein 1 (concanavalin A-like superfamily)